MNESTSENRHSRKRPWLAMVLTILIPGLGHVYLKLWLRALLWLVLYITATSFILPSGTTPDTLSLDAFLAAGEAVPMEAALLILGISIFCLVDAYLMTNQINTYARRASGEAPQSCPHCGKDLDEDLTFCHWCTTELEPQPEE